MPKANAASRNVLNQAAYNAWVPIAQHAPNADLNISYIILSVILGLAYCARVA